MKTSDQIRQDFIDFFASKQHLIVGSAPVVPTDDPTLLFTNAGMNQFKPVFLGEQPGVMGGGKSWKRVADTQKCIRVSGKHNDLEEVGHDTYHHTLFEMLGNWSFGDYFKEEAIEWAWELLIKKWGLDAGRMYATVFGGDSADGLPSDEEGIEIWKKKTTIDPTHILRFGKKENFWEMGDTGPCGPCSEIHVDLRSDEERALVDGATLVNKGDPRVMEIWNLVFIQFNRKPDGSLQPLPDKHVDTGMGFERICAVMQGKKSNYDTDVFTPIIKNITRLANFTYGNDETKDIAARVIADHIRAVSFSIADGASPGNDGRGYVIRRILRRAVRYGWDKLGLKDPFMFKLVEPLADQMAHVFPELKANASFVKNIIEAEEKAFLRTLGQGIALFGQMTKGKTEISGEDAFKLHDTFGFPIDLTALMAREMGIGVDEKGFERLMQEQKSRGRAAGKFQIDQSDVDGWIRLGDDKETNFVGYDSLTASSKITSFKKDAKKPVLVFETSPFYAESGGQVADKGVITNGDEYVSVLDVQKQNGKFLHIVDRLPENLDGNWELVVDKNFRKEAAKHHSATHLVHAALRSVLGEHVAQKGSLVDNRQLRFDFSHYQGVSSDELGRIERMVNEKIQENIALKEERDVPIEEAKKRGAMMLFGEKYGENVRIITFDPNYSVELCGGIHVKQTGEIGYFRFMTESSVAAGIRRIQAVTGEEAHQVLSSEKRLIESLRAELGADPMAEVKKLLEDKKSLEKQFAELKLQALRSDFEGVANAKTVVNGLNVISGSIANASMDQLKQLGYDSLLKFPKGTVTVLASKDVEAGKVYIVAAVSEDVIAAKGLKAGALVGQLAKMVGGGGGGQPNLATAGGKQPENMETMLAAVSGLLG